MLKVIQHLCQAAASWRPDWLQSRQDHSSDLQQSYTDRKIFLTPEGVLLQIYWLKRYIQSEMRGCGMWCENLTLKRALFKKSKHHTRVHGIQVKIFFQATMDVDKGCPPKACALQHLPGKHRETLHSHRTSILQILTWWWAAIADCKISRTIWGKYKCMLDGDYHGQEQIRKAEIHMNCV